MNKYTKQRVLPRLIIGILFFILMFVFAYLSFASIYSHSTNYYWILLEFISLFLAYKTLNPASNFIQGAVGEKKVGELLAKLPGHINVLKNLCLNKFGNIDFLVVDSQGIAVIEVKSHWGRVFFVDGRLRRYGKEFEKDFIKQVCSQAHDIQKVLKQDLGLKIPVPVQPFIVFSSSKAKMRFGMKPLSGTNVMVVKSDWINNAILRRNGYYQNQEQVERITGYLKQYCKP
ncbi:MAG: nuclease-related domain-containing protein [Patescibacteria group bacterium]